VSSSTDPISLYLRLRIWGTDLRVVEHGPHLAPLVVYPYQEVCYALLDVDRLELQEVQEDLYDLGERAVLAVRQLRRPNLAQDRAFAVQPLDKRLEFGLVQGSGFRV